MNERLNVFAKGTRKILANPIGLTLLENGGVLLSEALHAQDLNGTFHLMATLPLVTALIRNRQQSRGMQVLETIGIGLAQQVGLTVYEIAAGSFYPELHAGFLGFRIASLAASRT